MSFARRRMANGRGPFSDACWDDNLIGKQGRLILISVAATLQRTFKVEPGKFGDAVG